MIKGLKALKTIILGTNVDTYRSSIDEIDNAITIIKKELKELEQYKALETELGTTLKELCLFLKEGFSIEWNGKNVVAHAKKG